MSKNRNHFRTQLNSGANEPPDFLAMDKKVIKKSSGVVIESCNKLLEDFFDSLKKHNELDKQIVQTLEQLFKAGQLTADNITKALAEERGKINLHE